MTDRPLIRARWQDGVLRPQGNYAAAWLHDTLAEGEVITFEPERARDMRKHRGEFAWLKTAWDNLPESLADHPMAQSPETLRKHALIATGYCDVETLDAGSKAAAERMSAYVGALARRAHGYALVKASGPMVVCRTPHSQSLRAMGGDTFHASRRAILDWVSAQLGVAPEDLWVEPA